MNTNSLVEYNKWYFRIINENQYWYRPMHSWVSIHGINEKWCYAEVFRVENDILSHYYHDFIIYQKHHIVKNNPVSPKEIDDIKVRFL
jgi:hypothetical protein